MEEQIKQLKRMYYQSIEAFNTSKVADADYYDGMNHAFRMALLILGVRKM